MSHLKRSTRIHAPLERVYTTAHDPKHWSDWYVGLSEERDLNAATSLGGHRHMMVGTPFPLTQRVLEDHLGKQEARWRARSAAPAESVEVTRHCRLLMLSGEHDWTYKSVGGETEVTVVLDFVVPPEFLEQPSDQSTIEEIEAECLEQSLENLRRLCEVPH